MVRAEARQILERLYNGETCAPGTLALVLSIAMTSIDALEAHRSHLHKFGYVKGVDGKCACAYCIGDAEALANYAADLEMKNHSLTRRIEELQIASGNQASDGTSGSVPSEAKKTPSQTDNDPHPGDPTAEEEIVPGVI